MPILLTVRLPPRQKIILLLLFGLGIFVIIAAILTKIYCLVPALISYQYMNWYFREATVAMLVTNLPLTWSLLRDIFPGLKKWFNGDDSRFTPNTWPKNISSSAKRSRDVDLLSLTEQEWTELEKNTRATTISTSREGIAQDAASIAREEEEERAETMTQGRIHVKSDVTLDVEKARVLDTSYPVWDWNGNRDHVNATEVAGGSTQMQ